MTRTILGLMFLAILLVACSPSETTSTSSTTATTEPPAQTTTLPPPPLAMTSPAFVDGGPIPMKFTCDGEDVNPQLDLVGLPTETVALALIVDDPDAPVGVWDHWVEYDIGAADGDFTIEEGTGPIGIQGVNSWNLPGYGGPCPPDGETHTYTFAVFILKDGLDLPPAVDSATVRAAMEGKVIATVEIEGTYGR